MLAKVNVGSLSQVKRLVLENSGIKSKMMQSLTPCDQHHSTILVCQPEQRHHKAFSFTIQSNYKLYWIQKNKMAKIQWETDSLCDSSDWWKLWASNLTLKITVYGNSCQDFAIGLQKINSWNIGETSGGLKGSLCWTTRAERGIGCLSSWNVASLCPFLEERPCFSVHDKVQLSLSWTLPSSLISWTLNDFLENCSSSLTVFELSKLSISCVCCMH